MIGVTLRTKGARLGARKKAMSFVFNNFFASISVFVYNSCLFKYFLASFRLFLFDRLFFQ